VHARAAPLVLGAVAVLTLAGGACSSSKGSDRADPVVPVPTAPAETTTTAAPDPFAIPEVIDEAYVNRVLAELDEINGDAVREIVSRGAIPFESIERIRAIYNDPEYEQQSDGLRVLLEGEPTRLKAPPGNRKTTVIRLVRAGAKCIFAQVKVDFADVVVSPPPTVADEFQALILERTQLGADPKGLNRTSWSIRHDEVLLGGQQPKEERCED
jgi:hypothetical protein